jgi:8-oxo-dGTP pyrophosphatase MutT (NUDIX family)
MIKEAAGVVVVKNFDSKYKILCLYKDMGDRLRLDITKGIIDHGETEFQAAVREAEEEASITDLNFKWGFDYVERGKITFFVAETDSQPILKPNPETKQLEHVAYKWLTPEEALSEAPSHIRPGIKWATDKLRSQHVNI